MAIGTRRIRGAVCCLVTRALVAAALLAPLATAPAALAGDDGPPVAAGACCTLPGCTMATVGTCQQLYLGDGTTCTPDPCPVEACCTGTTCTIVPFNSCTGTALPTHPTTCGPLTCEPGACCAFGSCLTIDFAQCVAITGTFYANAGCGPSGDCPTAFVGACCAVSGACSTSTQAACAGVYQGDNSLCTPNPCPVTGACCNTLIGGCTLATASECVGTYRGNGTACDAGACVGACCNLFDGSCTLSIAIACNLGIGFQGLGTTCNPDPCPKGACCSPGDGSCSIRVASVCPVGYRGDGTTCNPDPCPKGACCDLFSGVCEIRVPIQCLTGYRGDGTVCSPDPCPKGACCSPLDGTCVIGPPTFCIDYHGDNTACNPNPCPPPGACCIPGNCFVLTQSTCLAPGVWMAGQTCSPSPCPPSGACCDAAGACTLALQTACATQFLTGGVCDPNPCPQPTGACCDGFGGCSLTTPLACTGFDFFSGLGTTCTPNNCELRAGACCDGGPCQIRLPMQCMGSFLGAASVCGAATCTFACCDTFTGACQLLTSNACLAAGKLPRGDAACGPTSCPGLGACCDRLTGSCQLLTTITCQNSFGGDGTVCGPATCPTGACCDNFTTACRIATISSCLTLYLGDNTTCSPTACPVGRCCDRFFPSCNITRPAACDGNFAGVGTTCTPDACPAGACCDQGGACTIATIAGCLMSQTTTYLGDATLCTPGACLPRVCCNPATGACSLGTLTACPDGLNLKPGATSCGPDTCPLALCRPAVIDATGSCLALELDGPSDIDAGSTGTGISLGVSPPGPYPIGVTPVTLTVTDADGLTSSCSTTVTVLALDANNDAVPDACQLVWNNGDCNLPPTKRGAPLANGQASHLGGGLPGGQVVADDFSVCPGQLVHMTAFQGRVVTSSAQAVRKAVLFLYEDCDGRPSGVPFRTFTNSAVLTSQPAPAYGPGFTVVTYGFDLSAADLWLEGGKSGRTYWAAIAGITDGQGADVSYWLTTGPARPMIGSVPVKAVLPPTGSWATPPGPSAGWTDISACCIGCQNMDFGVVGDVCACPWDNGPVATAAVACALSGTPPEAKAADNFVVRPCETSPLCLIEGWVWTNCVNPHPTLRLYTDECGVPGGQVLLVGSLRVLETGVTRPLNGVPFSLKRILFVPSEGFILSPGTYWASFGLEGGGSASEASYFARRGLRCDQGPTCGNIKISPARALPAFQPDPTAPVWPELGYDLAFRVWLKQPFTNPGIVVGQGAQATCPADVNASGRADLNDIFDFLSAWFAGCP